MIEGFFKRMSVFLFVLCGLASFLSGAEAIDNTLADKLIPLPKKAVFNGGEWFKLSDSAQVGVKTFLNLSEEDKSRIGDIFESYWDAEPGIEFSTCEDMKDADEEAYKVSVSENALEISAKSHAGVLHALKTLRQLAEPMRGTLKTEAYIIPQCAIEDSPSMKFRGMHITIMPETKAFEVEKKVRLAAYYKFNYVVLEFWGCYPSKVRPEFNFENPDLSRSDIKRIAGVAKELGVCLIPQMTVFGHASGSMFRSGKHSALDLNPEFAPLFEPTGWTWCLSNPHAKEAIKDMALEMWELFGKPEYFHIGCDEAYDFATCSECAKADKKELLKNHIMYFRDLFAKEGVKVMMWHDMLLEKEDPRWKGMTANAKPEQGLKDLYKELPKDIVVCCWEYAYLPKDENAPVFPTGKFFADAGFNTLMCSWTSAKNTDLMGKFVSGNSLYGMMGTMWYNDFGEPFQKIYMQTAAAAWGGKPPRLEEGQKSFLRRLNFDRHLRQVSIDMGMDKMEQSGRTENQSVPRFLY